MIKKKFFKKRKDTRKKRAKQKAPPLHISPSIPINLST